MVGPIDLKLLVKNIWPNLANLIFCKILILTQFLILLDVTLNSYFHNFQFSTCCKTLHILNVQPLRSGLYTSIWGKQTLFSNPAQMLLNFKKLSKLKRHVLSFEKPCSNSHLKNWQNFSKSQELTLEVLSKKKN